MNPKKHNLTVLLVEEEPETRDALSQLLATVGYRVLKASTERESIGLYRREAIHIDAVLLDLRLPVVHGLELVRLNYSYLLLPVVIFTSVTDARVAMEMLQYGVQDYVMKPVDYERLLNVLRSAIMRYIHAAKPDGDSTFIPGNQESISIPSKLEHIHQVYRWIKEKVAQTVPGKEGERFAGYINELVLNAHEHGNLKISEKEKAELIAIGKYDAEVQAREKKIRAQISIAVSLLQHEIAVRITDEGNGFDYQKYLQMTEDEVLTRLYMPNGRGINMASRYFDSIEYHGNGSGVFVTKRFEDPRSAASLPLDGERKSDSQA